MVIVIFKCWNLVQMWFWNGKTGETNTNSSLHFCPEMGLDDQKRKGNSMFKLSNVLFGSSCSCLVDLPAEVFPVGSSRFFWSWGSWLRVKVSISESPVFISGMLSWRFSMRVFLFVCVSQKAWKFFKCVHTSRVICVHSVWLCAIVLSEA